MQCSDLKFVNGPGVVRVMESDSSEINSVEREHCILCCLFHRINACKHIHLLTDPFNVFRGFTDVAKEAQYRGGCSILLLRGHVFKGSSKLSLEDSASVTT